MTSWKRNIGALLLLLLLPGLLAGPALAGGEDDPLGSGRESRESATVPGDTGSIDQLLDLLASWASGLFLTWGGVVAAF